MEIGRSHNFHGNVKPSSIEQASYDAQIDAIRYTETPSNLQMRLDYASRPDGQPVYQGFAGRGEDTSGRWFIYKFTYDTNGNVTLRQIAYDTWDNRAGATYA